MSLENTQDWVISTLAGFYVLLTIICTFNFIQLYLSKRLQHNGMLGAFYSFAFVTVTLRAILFILDATDLVDENSEAFVVFETLPAFLYIILGAIIFLFIVELII
jgi:hypothetical protein